MNNYLQAYEELLGNEKNSQLSIWMGDNWNMQFFYLVEESTVLKF